MSVLFVNACIAKQSRTKILADVLLSYLKQDVTEINLNKEYPKPFNEALLSKRNELILQKKFDDAMFSYAKQFALADTIVIAAPFWDFSFPALLKTYIEHINVGGIVFKYTDEGKIKSLCRAKKLYYVTTMGGYNPTDYGFGYIKALCKTLYGIDDVTLIKAEGLDIIGNDVKALLDDAKKQIQALFKK